MKNKSLLLQWEPILVYLNISWTLEYLAIRSMCMCAKSLQSFWIFATLWTITCQASLSMGFSREEYWSGLPCPPPGDLPDPGIKPMSLVSPALAGRLFTTEPLGIPLNQPPPPPLGCQRSLPSHGWRWAQGIQSPPSSQLLLPEAFPILLPKDPTHLRSWVMESLE